MLMDCLMKLQPAVFTLTNWLKFDSGNQIESQLPQLIKQSNKLFFKPHIQFGIFNSIAAFRQAALIKNIK